MLISVGDHLPAGNRLTSIVSIQGFRATVCPYSCLTNDDGRDVLMILIGFGGQLIDVLDNYLIQIFSDPFPGPKFVSDL